jgi:hypothetical protein
MLILSNMEHLSTLYGQNISILNDKSRDTCNNCALNAQIQGISSYNFVVRVNMFNCAFCVQFEDLRVGGKIILK